MPGLGSVVRKAGPAADENELEFISSLHQTCVPGIRMNGTISSSDISLFLQSKYGIRIHSETAKDIACNLCGARRTTERKKKSVSHLQKVKEKLSKSKSKSSSSSIIEYQSAEFADEDKYEEDDEEVYFDIVQLLSLLIIPNLLEFVKNDQKDIFETAIDCFLEPLYDEKEEEIRRTGEIDIPTLRKIFTAAGDLDSAQNEELMAQMIKLLQQQGSFSTESFAKCLISDVQDGFARDAVLPDSAQTSTFYDVFGTNWEKAGDTFRKFLKVPTFSFVDYASQSHSSNTFNTLLWGQFFFSILFYWIYLGKPEVDQKIKLGCTGFACDIAERTISWIVTGLLVGSFGLMTILSFGFTNTAAEEKKERTLFSTMAILSTSVVPYILLMVYSAGIPHNPIIYTSYRNICPPSYVAEGNKIPMVFDNHCDNIFTFCLNHIEFQGKNLLKNPSSLSYAETQRCIEGATSYGLFLPSYFCVNSTCSLDEIPICFEDSDCEISNYRGSCGHLNDNQESGDKYCCKSGTITLTANGPICTGQAPGSPCTTDAVCEGHCENGICVHGNNARLPIGSNCTSHENCTTYYCNWEQECDILPVICPTYLDDVQPQTGENQDEQDFLAELEVVLGYTKVPPVCVTEKRFCEDNHYPIVEESYCYETAIPMLDYVQLLVVKEKNETTSFVEQDDNLSPLEILLHDDIIPQISLHLVGILSFLSLCCIVYLHFYGSKKRERHYLTKKAAQVKISTLINNAFEMHQNEDEVESEGSTMRNYFASSKNTETVGGLMWTISAFKSGDLAEKYGIHIPSRLYIANSVQIITLIALVVASCILLVNGEKELIEFKQDQKPLTQEDVNKMTDEVFYRLSDARLLSAYMPSKLYENIPDGWMLVASIAPGIVVGTLVSIMCILVYIPSYVSTILQLRVGTIPNFHDPRFSELRSQSDKVNLNLGNIFFSMIGCFALVVILLGIVIFAFLWQLTRTLAFKLLAMGIGIGISTFLKIILQAQIRKRYFQTLYRKDSVIGNVANIFFECWYIATATLTVVVRIGVVVARLCLAMGRLDVSFMHPDIGSDAPADSFRREILVVEAHNHPYLDRLSGLYLRRLRDGENFGSPAGQAWRTLFVMGLCPWMIKYRANIASKHSQIKKIPDVESLQNKIENYE